MRVGGSASRVALRRYHRRRRRTRQSAQPVAIGSARYTRRHHDRVQQQDDISSRQGQDWPALVVRLEPVLPVSPAVLRPS